MHYKTGTKRTFHRVLERLSRASIGRRDISNRGRMLTDTSNGGEELIYVSVHDLRELLYHFDRVDMELRVLLNEQQKRRNR